MKIDLAIIAKDLKLSPDKVEKTVELLDAGNTIPFITRFRKDLTGGLDEQQILSIKQRVLQLRALTERKLFVLKSIESQGKLTDELKTQINKSTSSRRLEDLYLPFKPKKQSRASLARQQGLEPLAEDIFKGVSPDVDIATRATDFVRVDKGLTSVDDVIKGVGDLIAERLSENDELRSSLRKIMWNEGKLASVAIEKPGTETPTDEKSESEEAEKAKADTAKPEQPAATVAKDETASVVETVKAQLPKADPARADAKQPEAKAGEAAESETTQTSAAETSVEATGDDSSKIETALEVTASIETAAEVTSADSTPTPSSEIKTTVEATTSESKIATAESGTPTAESGTPTAESGTPTAESGTPTAESGTPTTESGAPTAESGALTTETPTAGEPKSTDPNSADPAKTKPKKKKKKKKKAVENPFKDYADFKQSLKQIPNHRVLALNRGARAGSLKVKIELDSQKLTEVSNSDLVPDDHPFKEFIEKCANDALTRMVVPSLEREIRRELTEAAEKHAVEVFANNLRNLLLQPPVRNRTVLAIDPGFKRGCSVAVLDPCGNLLDSGHVFVVGNQTRKDESKQKIADWVKQHNVDVIAIGNGAACRQTEQMVSDTIAEQLQDLKTTYAMVNEAGASIYSTSEIGREELPNVSPSIRSAASIGRRLQDPLSELVKISPANIGVGMYQHDVKAKHLSESLDEVVRFCVNQVGVDVNMASPSLLKFVSGLNSLTARRVVEHRATNGQFKNRAELKSVNGFGEATFVQSAGFLRIHNGDTPLDCTPIHPESYNIATDMLDQIGVPVEAFFPGQSPQKPLGSTSNNNEPVSTPEPTPADSAADSAAESPKSVTIATEPIEKDSAVDSIESASSATESNPESVQATPVEAIPTEVAPTDTTPTEATPTDTTPTDTTPTEATPTETSPVPAEPATLKSVELTTPSSDAVDSADRKENLKKISELDIDTIAAKHSAGKLLVKDIVMALKRPKWDPRDKVSKPIFRRGIIKADDLKPEMQLDGQVVNVVDFGVFVDIGLGESSLVHVSQLSNHFIRDPHRLFAIGDVMKVWVAEIDTERRRVKLTAIRPGSKKPQNRRRGPTRPQRTETSGSGKAASGSSAGTAAGSSTGKSSDHSRSSFKPGKYGSGPKGRSGQRSGSRPYNKDAPRRSHVRRSKPKEIKPITDKMLKGDEPMRSFSDLAQFVSKKPEDAKGNKDNKKDQGSESET